MSSAYNHSKLCEGEFRVMTLARGEPQDPLKCQLDHVNLQSNPLPSGYPQRLINLVSTYNALSYEWGDNATTAYLECDGLQIKITESLSTCLKCLRTKDADLVLWVDQICINQGDLQERSSQVRIMGDIYRNAATVISWLGDDPEGHSSAFKEFLAGIHPGDDGKPDVSCFVENHFPEKDSPLWGVLNTLMSLPYFTRVWIMQEVLLAMNVIFRWGNVELDLPCLRGFADAATKAHKRYYQSRIISMDAVHLVTSLTEFPRRYRSFETVIQGVTHRQSTDHRDRIYAILGLVEDGPEIVPDYTALAVDVFRDVVLRVIAFRQNLDVLSSAFHFTESELNPEKWPTWLPCWETPIPALLIELNPYFCASALNSYAPPLPQNAGRCLDVRGIQLPCIHFVSFGDNAYAVPKIWDAWKFASSFEPTKQVYGSSFLGAFTWTLLCDWPDNYNDAEMQNEWSKQRIFVEFASFWADWLARTVRYISKDEDPVSFIIERIGLAEMWALPD
jgi:Heterokaryon incompatibility protein (HET)